MQNQIPKNWQKVRLGDVADLQWGDTNITKASYKAAGYLTYSATGPDGYMDHYDFDRDGIVLSAIGANCGETWFACGKWSCIKNTIRFWGFEGLADTRFLYFKTHNKYLWPQRGSAQPFISQTDARDLEIIEPKNINEQKRIASILSSFDDKIEINNKIAKTLEEMAQAIFKEWFVKFKFPGHEKVKMVDSELGKIPLDWNRVKWSEVEQESFPGDWGDDEKNSESTEKVTVLRGTDIPSVKSGGLGECPIRFISKESLKKRQLRVGDIVIEISGGSNGQPTGRSIFITQSIISRFEYPLIPTSFCRLIRIAKQLNPVLAYLHLDGIYRTRKIWNYQLQSTGISNFQYSIFREYEYIIVPSRKIQEMIVVFLKNCIEFGQHNENLKLAQMRDLLLPKLMKGEIRV